MARIARSPSSSVVVAVTWDECGATTPNAPPDAIEQHRGVDDQDESEGGMGLFDESRRGTFDPLHDALFSETSGETSEGGCRERSGH